MNPIEQDLPKQFLPARSCDENAKHLVIPERVSVKTPEAEQNIQRKDPNQGAMQQDSVLTRRQPPQADVKTWAKRSHSSRRIGCFGGFQEELHCNQALYYPSSFTIWIRAWM